MITKMLHENASDVYNNSSFAAFFSLSFVSLVLLAESCETIKAKVEARKLKKVEKPIRERGDYR